MNNSKLIFRNATVHDISGIMSIEYSSFSDVICEEEKVFIERINTFPDGFRVMESDGEIIGYICSELWETVNVVSEELFTLGHSIKEQHKLYGREVYISSMGLSPKYRSLGLGRTMFDEFIKHITAKLANIESIILVVSEKWAKARRIYTSNGFREVDVLKKFFCYSFDRPYYEDGIVMRKHLM
jgi:[ribosomal protein S18]-alanine N-acetyltransferase